MEKICWNPLKGYMLKQKYGVSFENVIRGVLVDEIQHPKRDNQRIFIFEYDHYLWSIPYVVEKNGVFLKTIYPSRKLTKKYKRSL